MVDTVCPVFVRDLRRMSASLEEAKAKDGKERGDDKEVFSGDLSAGGSHARRDGRLRTLLRQAQWRLLIFEFVGELLRTRWVRRTA
jgi:hypothetical protein